MDIATHLMVGESISYAQNEILEAIHKGNYPKMNNWYAITTAYEENNLLYIMSGMEYRHPYYHRRGTPLKLIGLAGSRKEAILLVRDLIQQSVDSGSLTEIKASLGTY